MGSTIGPLEEKKRYDKNYSVAVNVASAPVGMLIPPSNTMIVYSSIAGSVSIAALFMAGYIPGILWGGAVMILAGIMAKKRGYQAEERVTFKIAMKTFWQAIPSLFTYHNCNRRYSCRCVHSYRRFSNCCSICNSSFTYL